MISDVGMSPVHFLADPPRSLDGLKRLYALFIAPEVETDYELVQQVPLETPVDIFSCGILFIYLLLPIERIRARRTAFQAIASQIRTGDIPILFPSSAIVRHPAPFLEVLWDTIRQMVGPVELRPNIDVVCARLGSVEAYLDSPNLENVPLLSISDSR